MLLLLNGGWESIVSSQMGAWAADARAMLEKRASSDFEYCMAYFVHHGTILLQMVLRFTTA